MNALDTRRALLSLIAARKPDATVCPSEVARAIAGDSNWREAMPLVHEVVDTLLTEGHVQLSWKGAPMPARSGPYRIAAVRLQRAGGAADTNE